MTTTLAPEPQLPLFELAPTVTPEHEAGATIQERFEAFHQRNPQVLDALVELALQMKRSGRSKCGLKLLWERLRWELLLQTDEEDPALPNEMTSRYARLIMERVPELDGFFVTRALRSE